MEGASCNPAGFERISPSLESSMVQPMSEQENMQPPASLRSLAPNSSEEARLSDSGRKDSSSQLERQRQTWSTPKSSSQVPPPKRPLQPLSIDLSGVNTSSSGQQPWLKGVEAEEEKQIPASVFQFPPPLRHNPPFHHAPLHHVPYQNQTISKKEGPVTCVVEQEGHLCLKLRYEVGGYFALDVQHL